MWLACLSLRHALRATTKVDRDRLHAQPSVHLGMPVLTVTKALRVLQAATVMQGMDFAQTALRDGMQILQVMLPYVLIVFELKYNTLHKPSTVEACLERLSHFHKNLFSQDIWSLETASFTLKCSTFC